MSSSCTSGAKTHRTRRTWRGTARIFFLRSSATFDFSKPTADVLAFLSGLPLVREVILLHVLPASVPAKDRGTEEAQAARNLEGLKTALDIPAHRVRTVVRYGDPAAEIATCAEKEDVSLILIPRFGSRDYATNIPLGRTAAGVAARAGRPLLVRYPHIHLDVEARECLAGNLTGQKRYGRVTTSRKQTGTPTVSSGCLSKGRLPQSPGAVRHPDGREVDGVFVSEQYPERGYAQKAVQALVASCGTETLYMHSTLPLVNFYSTFGFTPISEQELPEGIRARFDFAGGNLEGVNAVPMRRRPGSIKEENHPSRGRISISIVLIFS